MSKILPNFIGKKFEQFLCKCLKPQQISIFFCLCNLGYRVRRRHMYTGGLSGSFVKVADEVGLVKEKQFRLFSSSVPCD